MHAGILFHSVKKFEKGEILNLIKIDNRVDTVL